MCEHLRREITKHIDNIQAVKDFGAFVTIEQNVDGLCHRSEYSLSSAPSKGDSVYVKIIKIEYDSGKVAMSMSSVNQETGQENKEKRFYKVDLGSRSKWISKRSPYPKHKLTSTSYVSSHLHANDAVYYSAAGVFAYRLTPSKKMPLEILVGVEDQWDKRSKKPLPDRINFLGGKREEEVRVCVHSCLSLSLSFITPRACITERYECSEYSCA